jgi:uncharacterized membrane protein
MDELPGEAEFQEWLRFSETDAAHEARRPPPVRGRHLVVAAVIGAALVVLGMIVLWPAADVGERDRGELSGLLASEVYPAEVVSTGEGPCPGCVDVGFRLGAGPDTGTVVVQTFSDLPGDGFSVCDAVVLGLVPDAPIEFRYQFLDRQRRGVLWIVAAAFALAVVALGRMRGLAALAGLGISLVVLLRFILPAILDGKPPVLVAVVGSAAIAYVALYLAHGFTLKSTVALLGALSALALTALLSAVTVAAAGLTGLATEESFYLRLFSTDLDFQGLVLAGIVLGALGALDDVTVTQASSVAEVRAANPDLVPRDLMHAGMRIGRDHIASTVNTLLLAYAGAALPLLVLFVLSGQSLGTVVNSEAVATEVIRTLVGSIGLIAAVPLTTWLAAYTAE